MDIFDLLPSNEEAEQALQALLPSEEETEQAFRELLPSEEETVAEIDKLLASDTDADPEPDKKAPAPKKKLRRGAKILPIEAKMELQLFSEGEVTTASQRATRSGVKKPDQTARKKFSTIRQGTGTNALTKFRAVEGQNTKIDLNGTATITQGDFILTIPNYTQLTGLKTSTYQLLDALTVALTESGAKSPTVVLPLSEYMSRRGLKDRKEAKAQAKADMEILRGASFSWEEKRGKKTETYSFVNLADSGEIKRNGDIVFTYGTTFYNILLGYAVMPYPAQLQRLNNRKNPNSYYLLRKIAEHKNMNVGHKNEDIISVKTLLKSSPYIPTYEEVMAKDRALSRRIIEPFERDMDALSDTLKWHYCRSGGTTDDRLESTPAYEDFIGRLVKIEWNSYPDQTARLERRAESIEENTRPKKKKSSKKKTTKESGS